MTIKEKPPGTRSDRQNLIIELREFNLPKTELTLVLKAHDFARYSLENIPRDDGTNAYKHSYRAVMALVAAGIGDATILSTLFLHDVFEDSNTWAPFKEDNKEDGVILSYSKRIEIASPVVAEEFGPEIARGVFALSKPNVDGVEIKTKEEADRIYEERFENEDPWIVLCKLGDRIDNIWTLPFRTPLQQRRQIEETINIYLPMFERRLILAFPNVTQILITDLEKALASAQLHLNSIKKIGN
jgi:(p)ppGpp synthase/HD superfamily hydrolase